MTMEACGRRIASWACQYNTPKYVSIRWTWLGVLYKTLVLGILAGVFFYGTFGEKNYQKKDEVVSATSVNVEGIALTNSSGEVIPGMWPRVWDTTDYVIPSKEKDSFSVMTNAILTRNQTQGKCPADNTNPDAQCKTRHDCPAMEPIPYGNGIRTGKCDILVKACEVYAWCPVQKADDFPIPGQPLINVENFTVLIKNQIEFPKFNVKRRNILKNYNSSYLRTCRYDANDAYDKYCPTFEIGYILREAGVNITEISIYGGIILINIEWNCNLDWPVGVDKCLPKYSFRQLDDPDTETAYIGYSFKDATYYYRGDVLYRDLFDVYAIHFTIKVTGEARKWNFIKVCLCFGSGFAFIGLATLVLEGLVCCDNDIRKEKHEPSSYCCECC